MPQGAFIDPQATFQRSQLARALSADRFRQLEFRKNVIDFQTQQFEQARFSQNLQRAAVGLAGFFKKQKQKESLSNIEDLFGGQAVELPEGVTPTFDPDIVGPPSPFPDESVSNAGGLSLEQPSQQQPSFEMQKFQALIQLMKSGTVPFDAAALLQAAPDTTTAQQKLNRGLATLDGRQFLDGKPIPPEKQAPLTHEEKQLNDLRLIEARQGAATQGHRERLENTAINKVAALNDKRTRVREALDRGGITREDADLADQMILLEDAGVRELGQKPEPDPIQTAIDPLTGMAVMIDPDKGQWVPIPANLLPKPEKTEQPDPLVDPRSIEKAISDGIKAAQSAADFKNTTASFEDAEKAGLASARASTAVSLRLHYLLSGDEQKRQQLAEAYTRLTGGDITQSAEAKAGATIAGPQEQIPMSPEQAQHVIDQWRSLTPEQRQNMPDLQREIFRAATNVPGVK